MIELRHRLLRYGKVTGTLPWWLTELTKLTASWLRKTGVDQVQLPRELLNAIDTAKGELDAPDAPVILAGHNVLAFDLPLLHTLFARACAPGRTVCSCPLQVSTRDALHPLRGAADGVARRGVSVSLSETTWTKGGDVCIQTGPYVLLLTYCMYGLHSPETRHLVVPGACAHSGYPYRTCGSRSRHRPCGHVRLRVGSR